MLDMNTYETNDVGRHGDWIPSPDPLTENNT